MKLLKSQLDFVLFVNLEKSNSKTLANAKVDCFYLITENFTLKRGFVFNV